VAAPQVDFYVLQGAGADGLPLLACRLVDKAWAAGQPVCIYDPDAGSLESLDTRLWTFSDGSFIPHERVEDAAAGCEAPVALVAARPPDILPRRILINLGAGVPDFATEFERVIELVDEEPQRRERGRERFRAWRRLGVEPRTHNLGAGRDSADD
jgi:DNA polymerase-3 subunit chi